MQKNCGVKLLKILKFIVVNNKEINIVKHLVKGLFYYVFKNIYKHPFAIRIFNNTKIFQFSDSPTSSFFCYTSIPDKNEINLLRTEVKNTNHPVVFIDIGANIGSYSICMMDICERVLAFRTPSNFSKLV